MPPLHSRNGRIKTVDVNSLYVPKSSLYIPEMVGLKQVEDIEDLPERGTFTFQKW